MSKTTGGGYGKPPASTRFPKGRSGNPKGRHIGRHNRPPYDAVLGQMVTIKENGLERRVTAAEAFLLSITKRGLEGDGAAARAAMAAIEEARSARRARGVGVVYVGHGIEGVAKLVGSQGVGTQAPCSSHAMRPGSRPSSWHSLTARMTTPAHQLDSNEGRDLDG